MPLLNQKARKSPIVLSNDIMNLSSKSISNSDLSDGENSKTMKKKKTSANTNKEMIKLEKMKFELYSKTIEREYKLKELEYNFRQEEFYTNKQLREFEIEKQAVLAKELKQMDIVKDLRLELMRAKLTPLEINDFIAQMFGTDYRPI
jgi:hypothetical protein